MSIRTFFLNQQSVSWPISIFSGVDGKMPLSLLIALATLSSVIAPPGGRLGSLRPCMGLESSRRSVMAGDLAEFDPLGLTDAEEGDGCSRDFLDLVKTRVFEEALIPFMVGGDVIFMLDISMAGLSNQLLL